MAVTIVFLGRLADLAGEPQRQLSAPLDWDGLCSQLGPELASAVADDRVMLALNGQVFSAKTSLTAGEGDEVALLPPVSGG